MRNDMCARVPFYFEHVVSVGVRMCNVRDKRVMCARVFKHVCNYAYVCPRVRAHVYM